MLSPTLDLAIEEALAAQDKARAAKEKMPIPPSKRPRAESNTSDRSTPKSISAGKKLPAPSPMGRAASPNKSLPTKKVSTATASKTLKRHPSPKPAASPRPSKTQPPAAKHPVPAPRTLIIKLKFKKRRFQDVLTLQKLSASKRQRQDDDPGPTAKRLKALNTQKTTARPPVIKSPTLKPPREVRGAVTPPRKTNGVGSRPPQRTDATSTVITPSGRPVPQPGSEAQDHAKRAPTTKAEKWNDEYNR